MLIGSFIFLESGITTKDSFRNDQLTRIDVLMRHVRLR